MMQNVLTIHRYSIQIIVGNQRKVHFFRGFFHKELYSFGSTTITKMATGSHKCGFHRHKNEWAMSSACATVRVILLAGGLYCAEARWTTLPERAEACLECHCNAFDTDRCMNSLKKRQMSMCSRSMVVPTSNDIGQVFWAFFVMLVKM